MKPMHSLIGVVADMKHRSPGVMACLLAALSASCAASFSRTTKTEERTDGSSTRETTTTLEGEAFRNGGTIKTDGTSVEVTVQGPNGTTTETPAPGQPVPVPEGSTSVETKETVEPAVCPNCGHPLRSQTAGGANPRGGHRHGAYHRFERYVPVGGWEAFLYTEDASALIDGENAAKDFWRELVANTASGFPQAPFQPSLLGDVRFYGMRMVEEGGQLYVSFADIRPFDSLSLTIHEVGTSNTAEFDLDTPGTIQTSANGWYFATIPIDFVPANVMDPRIELLPVIENVGVLRTKGYLRTLGW